MHILLTYPFISTIITLFPQKSVLRLLILSLHCLCLKFLHLCCFVFIILWSFKVYLTLFICACIQDISTWGCTTIRGHMEGKNFTRQCPRWRATDITLIIESGVKFIRTSSLYVCASHVVGIPDPRLSHIYLFTWVRFFSLLSLFWLLYFFSDSHVSFCWAILRRPCQYPSS